MVAEDLGLQTVRLPAHEEWSNDSSAWNLFLVQKGSAAFRATCALHRLAEEDALLVPSGIKGRMRSQDGPEVSFLFLKFWPEYLAGILTLAERLLFQRAATAGSCIAISKNGASLLDRLEKMSASRLVPGTLDYRCELIRLIGPLMEHLRQTPQHSGMLWTRLASVLEEMTASDMEEMSVEELARRCGCSRRHLCRLVQRRFGCSLLALKTQLRLERAAMLLHDPESKVTSVAMQCGFNHLGEFAAKFKKQFGSTPAKWREGLDGALAEKNSISEEPGGKAISRAALFLFENPARPGRGRPARAATL